jgi:hypothetical protein
VTGELIDLVNEGHPPASGLRCVHADLFDADPIAALALYSTTNLLLNCMADQTATGRGA